MIICNNKHLYEIVCFALESAIARFEDIAKMTKILIPKEDKIGIKIVEQSSSTKSSTILLLVNKFLTKTILVCLGYHPALPTS